jgi:hypothetical protein
MSNSPHTGARATSSWAELIGGSSSITQCIAKSPVRFRKRAPTLGAQRAYRNSGDDDAGIHVSCFTLPMHPTEAPVSFGDNPFSLHPYALAPEEWRTPCFLFIE